MPEYGSSNRSPSRGLYINRETPPQSYAHGIVITHRTRLKRFSHLDEMTPWGASTTTQLLTSPKVGYIRLDAVT